MKRSDEMLALLLQHGITVNSDNQLEPSSAYDGFKFQINGKIKFENDDPISTHQFIKEFV